MSLKIWKKGESATGTETERGSGTEAGRENLTDGSMIETGTGTEIGIESASADESDLAAESGNVGKNAPGTERGIRTGRGTENDETGAEAERDERTGKTINMIHPETVTMTKSNGFMHLHMRNLCM